MRVKSLGVLITASFLTLGACAEATPTAAPPAASPATVDASPTGLPGVIPGETVPAADDTAEDPIATDAAG